MKQQHPILFWQSLNIYTGPRCRHSQLGSAAILPQVSPPHKSRLFVAHRRKARNLHLLLPKFGHSEA